MIGTSRTGASRVGRHEVRIGVWWRPLTRREREVMTRVLERHARELLAEWEAEDASVPQLGRDQPSPRAVEPGQEANAS